MNKNTRFCIRAAVIAAVYVLLTLVWPLSFGPVQVRISEALTVLPLMTPAAVPGLFLGCLLSGILSGSVWIDVALGSLATLLSAFLTRKLRDKPLAAALLPPVLLNAIITGSVIHFCYAGDPAISLLPLTMLSVGAGEAAAVYLLGIGLMRLLRALPDEILT